MVVEHAVADTHGVAHVVAGLVISDAVPEGLAVAGQIIDGVDVGLGFHEPELLGGHENSLDAQRINLHSC